MEDYDRLSTLHAPCVLLLKLRWTHGFSMSYGNRRFSCVFEKVCLIMGRRLSSSDSLEVPTDSNG